MSRQLNGISGVAILVAATTYLCVRRKHRVFYSNISWNNHNVTDRSAFEQPLTDSWEVIGYGHGLQPWTFEILSKPSSTYCTKRIKCLVVTNLATSQIAPAIPFAIPLILITLEAATSDKHWANKYYLTTSRFEAHVLNVTRMDGLQTSIGLCWSCRL